MNHYITGVEMVVYQFRNMKGFPGGSAGKESACNDVDLGLIPGLGMVGLKIPSWGANPLGLAAGAVTLDERSDS